MKKADQIEQEAFAEAEEINANKYAYALGVFKAKYDSLRWDYQELKSKLEKKQ